jgi:hypothetical protein
MFLCQSLLYAVMNLHHLKLFLMGHVKVFVDNVLMEYHFFHVSFNFQILVSNLICIFNYFGF